jgi:predicted RNase H-like nuclease (RuvC/YqgF family)
VSWELLLSSTALGSVITGAGAWLIRRMEVRKYDAEVLRLQAEAHKLRAETDDLTSARLIRELDAISARNTELAGIVSRQSEKIEQLRNDIFKYAQREAEHAIENATLKQRIKELEAPTIAPTELKDILNAAYPPEIPSTFNEFDDQQE